tara:strand:- start:70 stop:252 length:183 start_codon:yes stop_codon:yes gene_type:complete
MLQPLTIISKKIGTALGIMSFPYQHKICQDAKQANSARPQHSLPTTQPPDNGKHQQKYSP